MKKLNIILILCLSFVLTGVNTFAEEPLSLNVQDGVITVSGTLDSRYLNEELYISVTKPDSRITDIGPGRESNLAYFNSFIPDGDGNIEIEFQISEPIDDYYHLYIRGNDLYSSEPLCEAAINPVRNIISGTAGIREDCVPLTGETVEERFKERWAENQTMLPEIPLTEISDEYTKIYVDGSVAASGNGSFEAPYKTINEALSALEGNAWAKAIVIGGGTYNISSEISIAKTHSGKKSAPLIITAYEDEEVVLTNPINIPTASVVKVTDTSVLNRLDEDARESVYEIDMDALGIGAENYNISLSRAPRLILNDFEMRLARYPEDTNVSATVEDPGYPRDDTASYDGKAYIADLDDGFSLKDEDKTPLSWNYTNDIWMKGVFAHEWMSGSYRVSEPFTETEDGIIIKTDNVPTFFGNAYYARTGNYYYFNVLEELNSPGEWVADKENGKIYFYPPTNSDLNKIILIKGSTQVEKVHGSSEEVTNIFKITNASNIVIDKIRFEDCPSTCIYVKNSNNIKVQNCFFENVTYGCDMKADVSESGIIYSKFNDANGAGVRFSDRSYYGEILFPNAQQNYIQNCIFKGSSVNFFCAGSLMSHNLISDTGGTAVNAGGQDNIIEYNEISGAPHTVTDSGAIYLGGHVTSRGNIVRYNYIHDIVGAGIYFDDRLSDNYAYGNIVNCSNYPIVHIHSGNENVIANNIALNGRINESMNYYKNSGWPERVMKTVSSYVKSSTSYNTRYDILYSAAWQGRYPGMISYLDRMDKAYELYLAGDEAYKEDARPHDNVFYNNALINATLLLGDGRVADEGTVHGNETINITSVEALPLIKSGNFSFIKETIPGFEDINFSAIGLNVEIVPKDFGFMYPSDNITVSTEETVFIFNEIYKASKYIVQISENEDFSGDIKEFKTVNKWCTVSGLDANKQYYWRVKAVFDEVDYIFSSTQEFKTAKKLSPITLSDEAFEVTDTGTEYSVTVNGEEEWDKPLVLIAAAFDKEGRLLGCDIKEYTETDTIDNVSGTVVGSVDTAEVIFFVWETIDNLIPLIRT